MHFCNSEQFLSASRFARENFATFLYQFQLLHVAGKIFWHDANSTKSLKYAYLYFNVCLLCMYWENVLSTPQCSQQSQIWMYINIGSYRYVNYWFINHWFVNCHLVNHQSLEWKIRNSFSDLILIWKSWGRSH